ncbi:alpha/beta hydrolase [Paenibacillus daejeonensis]|uniref:alpha/beta hydrolase n=1 Tax=Paenibacillus daejeonensis TaxID=135193 RepID=UPI00037FA2F0|nr:alpha/beta hydrolase [Paenibacillus daejeonensis]
MVHETLVMPTADGLELFAQEWRSDDKPAKAVVCLVHGMGEHSTRYQAVAETLTGEGYVLFTYDQRGHGRSPGKRGHTPSVERLTEDAERAIGMARKRHPDTPVFLYGHSMGGNVSLSCALRRQPDIQGLILTSPWLRLAFDPPRAKQWIGRQVARVWPSFSLATGLDPGQLYRPDQEVAPVVMDMLAHNRISAAMYFGLQAEGEWALAHASERLHAPMLLLHGTADRVTSYVASQQLAGCLDGRCAFYSWQDGLHELHNDRERREVMQCVVRWMEDRLSDNPAESVHQVQTIPQAAASGAGIAVPDGLAGAPD